MVKAAGKAPADRKDRRPGEDNMPELLRHSSRTAPKGYVKTAPRPFDKKGRGVAGLQDTAADVFAFRRAGKIGAPLFDQGQGAVCVLLFIKRQILIELISVPHTQYKHRELAAAAPLG